MTTKTVLAKMNQAFLHLPLAERDRVVSKLFKTRRHGISGINMKRNLFPDELKRFVDPNPPKPEDEQSEEQSEGAGETAGASDEVN